MKLTKREVTALSDLVTAKIQAMVESNEPYPAIVKSFWLPLLKKLGGGL